MKASVLAMILVSVVVVQHVVTVLALRVRQ
jgi:hypothetical protein